jgi:hypothetical protein
MDIKEKALTAGLLFFVNSPVMDLGKIYKGE